ncbi:MAG: bifunctional 3-(3-hydroxy-phenyl)propionate/3-hydroxycinnamic acid hydroxylase [Hyphomicrobiales bacterium]
MTRHVPVVVVGAGPTGLMTANLLGMDGVETLVIERNASTVEEPRAVSIDDEALRTIQAAGLIDDVIDDLMLDYGSHYFTPGGRCFARVEPDTREYGYPRRNAFRQPLLEATLRVGLNRYKHVDVLFGHSLESFEQDDDRVRLSIVRPDDAKVEYTCDYLAACDGGRSSVRRGLGVPFEGSSFEQRWLIIDLQDTKDSFRQTRVFSNPRRPGISLPGPHGTRRLEFMLRDDEDDETAETEMFARRLLHAHGPDGDCKIVRRQVYTFHARHAEHWRKGRIFLLGDAAHLTPPFAGQGMNSGIRDAHNFAWKAAAVVNGRLSQDVLDTYERERKPHAWALIELALMIGRVMVPTSPVNAWMQQALFRLLSLCPPAHRYVTQMRFKPKPFYKTGFLTPAADAKRAGLVGRMFPQFTVETSEREHALLDHVTGNGFALLAYSSDPVEACETIDRMLDVPHDVSRLFVVPRTVIPVAREGMAVVRDATGAMGRLLAGCPETLVLIRPDRYVAAAVDLGKLAPQAAAIHSLLPSRLSSGEGRKCA